MPRKKPYNCPPRKRRPTYTLKPKKRKANLIHRLVRMVDRDLRRVVSGR